MRVLLVILLALTQICCYNAHITIDWKTSKREASHGRRTKGKQTKKMPLSNNTESHEQRINYFCYEPLEGLSQPIITIFSAMNWPSEDVQNFIRRNRLGYAKRHQLRYCELRGNVDFGRNMNWQRDAFILAILPCTDYTVYMDTDAIFLNKEYTFFPWINYMEKENLDMLMTEDYFPHVPMNSGVFITRNSKWSYHFIRAFYNICACDRSRLTEWPYDQGVQYDFYMQYKNDHKFITAKHVQLSKMNGLNEIWRRRLPLGSEHFIAHFVLCCPNPATGQDMDDSFPHKYIGIKHMYESVIPNSQDSSIDVDKEFTQHVDQCKPMVWKELISKEDFAVKTWASGVVDFDLDKAGNIERVEAKGIQCIESQQHECSLKVYNYR